MRLITAIAALACATAAMAGAGWLHQAKPLDSERGGPISVMGTPEESEHWVEVTNIVQRGDDLADLGKWNDAVAVYQQAMTFEPECHPAYEGIGDVYMQQGNYDAAIRAYKKAVTLYSDAINHWRLAVAYGRVKDFDDAVKEYQIGLNHFHRYPEEFTQALSYSVSPNAFSMPHIESVLLMFRASDFAAHGYDKRNLSKAISLYRQALALQPKSAEVELLLGESLTEAQSFDEARQLFKAAAATGNNYTVKRARDIILVLPSPSVTANKTQTAQ